MAKKQILTRRARLDFSQSEAVRLLVRAIGTAGGDFVRVRRRAESTDNHNKVTVHLAVKVLDVGEFLYHAPETDNV